jgi:excisionase family DNA binding protein
MQENQGRVFRAKAAAEFLGLAPATLYRMASTRAIPTIKLGKVLLFREEDLLSLLEAGLRPAAADCDRLDNTVAN